ncbi:hypothetical protein FISHEDRAFT_66846 [Fistulina hepatica ATCC 64428]|uniref:Uncharacterized protein n=1 Tax=Fistulina hepatica ATCC 64428 TaxID=1128425 RepID=A0A0D7A792_9AGAR|nr:hypothetical protein FISHEDRAFT_66846 [Fistulina hepatica ATCC 64428]
MANSHNDLFDYTSGRWVFNDALRHAERRLVFDVEGLRRLAAQSVRRSPADVVNLSKLAEGGFNRTFLITLRDDFQMVARIPYPATVPKYYAVASEVATMEFLRSSGLPVPQVYGYSPASDNAAKTEYIFMEFMRVVSLLDWQHASILPLFLLAGVPQRLQNHDDPVSQSMMPPSLPENFDKLEATKRNAAEEVYRRRLVHYHYITNTEEYNKPHYDALTDPMCVLRSRLFHHASNPWEGETLELKVALIRATERWEMLTGGGTPCPVVFDAEDARETTELNEVQRKADKAFEVWQDMLGLGPEGWVPTQDYKEAVALCKQMKEEALTEATSEAERAEIMVHWPWDDMDEGKYM